MAASKPIQVKKTETFKIILIGDEGCRKSGIGNKLLGWEAFVCRTQETPPLTTKTKFCAVGSVREDNLILIVVDTPGFSYHISNEGFSTRALKIERSLLLTEGNPNMFLMPVDIRALGTINRMLFMTEMFFGEESLKHLLVVIIGTQGLDTKKEILDDLVKRNIKFLKIKNIEQLTKSQILQEKRNFSKKWSSSPLLEKEKLQMTVPSMSNEELTTTHVSDFKEKLKKRGGHGGKDDEVLQLVVVGRAGNGKSSTCNSLVGWEAFLADDDSSSVTKGCVMAEGEREGRIIRVVDTPGTFDDVKNFVDTAAKIYEGLHLIKPGPNAFIHVVRCDCRFTVEEDLTIDVLKFIFGKEFTQYAGIAFTHLDGLKRPLEKYVSNSRVWPVVEAVQSRYWGIDNTNEDSLKNDLPKMFQDIHSMNGYYKGNNEDVYKLLKEHRGKFGNGENIQKQLELLTNSLEEERKLRSEKFIKGCKIAGVVASGVALTAACVAASPQSVALAIEAAPELATGVTTMTAALAVVMSKQGSSS